MNSKIKAQKITNWAALIVSIIAQVVGWIPTCYLFASGDVNVIGALFSSVFLICAFVFTVISFIFILKKKFDLIKGKMIGKMIMVSIMAILSAAGAVFGTIFVSREDEGYLALLACLVVMILNIVFTVIAANSIEVSGNQAAYANQIAYANQPSYANRVSAAQQPTYSNPVAANQPSYANPVAAQQPTYANPTIAQQPAYANPTIAQQPAFSDEIIFTENGKPVQ